ncbi:hypothetical protein HPB52_019000 [Rhipicephalus sanguineus]|uniref:Uncharacterized protein n=1 Tax=Rhipicephalus sanguineus TaxID=34632 RepID=A0A9D4T041_RHISA|nr:hypothetical protein HPB52_019000 [Rhipicephalus sanguineus]
MTPQGPKGDNSGHNLYEVLYSDPTVMRNSCSVNSLKRMMMTERAIKQTQASVSRVRRAIEQRLQQRLQLHERLAEQEKVQLRIGLLKEVIEERSRQLEKEQVACRAKAQELADKEKHLAAMAAELVEKRNTLVERRRHYFEVRENLLKTSSRLLFRQKELITELAFIYPVVSFPEEKGYTICLVHLPNSEDFSDRDDQMISVALGYVAHTLLMMSHFLDMPLRYPLIHCGSMSSVRDNLIEHFTDKEREFPLYMKGKDRMTFNYGVYLLNRNIAQLRCYCNIVTKDLRTTLHNLHGLYEFYSIKQNSQPSSAPVPVPASPLAVPIKGNNTIGSAREQRSSDHVLSPPTAKREDMEHIFKCGEEPSGGAEASAAVAPQKLSSSLDKGLDSFQSTVTTEPEDKRSTALPVKFPTLKSSYRLSEPNLREFEARTMFKERRAVTEHLLPVPPVVYDATEESGSLNSGDGIVEVAVDTLFDADLTARTEQLARPSGAHHEAAENSRAVDGETSHREAAETSREVVVVPVVTSLHGEEPVESLFPEVGVSHHEDEGDLPHLVQGTVQQRQRGSHNFHTHITCPTKSLKRCGQCTNACLTLNCRLVAVATRHKMPLKAFTR